MTINAVRCEYCGCVIYSRCKDDYRECECKLVSVSGGQAAQHVETSSNTSFKKMKIDVDVTHRIMYDDFESGNDRYGFITESEYNERYCSGNSKEKNNLL